MKIMIDNRFELLAPAGNKEKLMAALHFGADAVYLSGKSYGLRAFGENFDYQEIIDAVRVVHAAGKKIYVTVNIFAHNADFDYLADFLKFLAEINVDAIIVSDPGIIYFAKKAAPSLEIHLSTQANTTNKYSVAFWAEMGIRRIVLARELSLAEIKDIRSYLPENIQLETFVHGAMCMAYSGRCLLSNFLSGRASNRGECSQVCRWEYAIAERKRPDELFEIQEDSRGTYILNSKDLNMLAHMDKLIDAGISSFKIEGRIKSSFYAGVVTNAYRRAIDTICAGDQLTDEILNEPYTTNHRNFTTGFYFGKDDLTELKVAKHQNTHEFTALVLEKREGCVLVEMRNRFKVGEELEVLSPTKNHNKKIKVESMRAAADNSVIEDAYIVQQKILLDTSLDLLPGDMLRKKLV